MSHHPSNLHPFPNPITAMWSIRTPKTYRLKAAAHWHCQPKSPSTEPPEQTPPCITPADGLPSTPDMLPLWLPGPPYSILPQHLNKVMSTITRSSPQCHHLHHSLSSQKTQRVPQQPHTAPQPDPYTEHHDGMHDYTNPTPHNSQHDTNRTTS